MEQYSLKKVRLPNGTLVQVPETATQEATMAYAKAKGYMSEDEMMIYDEAKDMLDVADFYAETDAVGYGLTDPATSAVFDVVVKPLAKFGYAAYKEPKTAARVLPDVGSLAGTAAAGGLAIAGGLATVPTALALGLGSALGYLGGKEGEQAITGVEESAASTMGEAAAAGATEAGISLLSPAVRMAVRGVRGLTSKSLSLSSEFASEAQREFAADVAKRMQQEGAGLLTTQVGTPSGVHGLLGSIAFSSSTGREKVTAVLKGQADFLDKNISVIKNMYGNRLTDRQLGDMYVGLVEKQKELSKEAFEGLFSERLKGTETSLVSTSPIVGLAKNQIDSIKGSSGYVDTLSDLTGQEAELKQSILAMRQEIIDTIPQATSKEAKEALSRLRLELDQKKLDLDVVRADKERFIAENDIGMGEETVLSLYNDMLKLQNKPDITIEELNRFNLNLKARLRELESNNPAVANIQGYHGLMKAQTLIEKQVKSKLTPEQVVDYDSLNKLYKDNNDVVRGNVVASLMRRENTPTSIANSITASGNADYFTSIDDLAKVTRNTLNKAGADPAKIKQFDKSINTLKDGVRRKYLEKNLAQYASTSEKDAFKSVGSFVDFINKEAKGDVFDELFGSGVHIKRIDSLLNDYNFLVENLPKGSGGRFSLAVISQQSVGSREALSGGARALAGDPTGISTFMQGFSKMFIPEALAWHVTNPREAMRLTAITKKAKQDLKRGKITIQTFTALSNAYNDMLLSMQEEQDADALYKDVMSQMQQLEQ